MSQPPGLQARDVPENSVGGNSGAGRSSRPTVLVWRRNLLPISETFIRNQVDAVVGWDARLVGHRRVSSVLARESDTILRRGRPSILVRLADRMFGLRVLDRSLRFRPDIIHAHYLPDAIDVMPYAKRTKTPLIVTAHGYDVNTWPASSDVIRPLRPLVRLNRMRRIRRLFLQVSKIVVVSEFLRDSIIRLGADPVKVVVSYVGVPAAERSPIEVSTGGREGILFVGRLQNFKGPQDVLVAVARLDSTLRRTPITIVGDGPLRHELERLAERLNLNVHFTGALSGQQIQLHYQRARLFCAPSQSNADGVVESFGMVFLEASSAELPIVAYSVGGVPEAVTDGWTGTLVAEGNIEALARAIEMYLVDDALSCRVGRQGRDRVRAEFLVTERVKILEKIYDEVLVSSSI